jgi:uncharacterized membrane protein YphA (DoxX/SURF4 family)
MNDAVRVCQILLAALFLVSGTAKISMSRERLLATGQTGIAPFPMPVIRVTAAAELLVAVCLIMPLITPAPSGVLPVLAPLAAVGLAAVMVGVAASHLHLHELCTATANLVIPAVCVVVAVARFAGL